MPMYLFKCSVCGKEYVIRAEITNTSRPHMSCCDKEMELVIQPPTFFVEGGTGAYKDG